MLGDDVVELGSGLVAGGLVHVGRVLHVPNQHLGARGGRPRLTQRARRWRQWSAALTIVLAGALGWGWIDGLGEDKLAWDRSASLQDDVVAAILRALPNPPAGSTIYAFGAPTVSRCSRRPGTSPVPCDSGLTTPHWRRTPPSPARRLLCGERDISASNANDPFDPQSASYGKAFVIDVSASRAFRDRDGSTCRSTAASISPSP